ncbi:unnamed protein product [Lota lota]
MPVKGSRRLGSQKKKKLLTENTQSEVLMKLGLEEYQDTPLDPASMLDISSWSEELQPPLRPKDLPRAFLQSLWLLRPEARSPRCLTPNEDASRSPAENHTTEGHKGESCCPVNPLDLLAGVYMSADSFLRQEIAVRMVRCQFAVPLVLPSVNPEQPSVFLLWSLRSVVSHWRPQSTAQRQLFSEVDLASTCMPLVSCVRIGHCGTSKSKVLSHMMAGAHSRSEMFLHRGMEGGQIPRKLCNGLVEVGWCLPSGDPESDVFPEPVVISNLRGDASTHDKCLRLLCRASSAVVVFCGTLKEKEKDLLSLMKGMARTLVLVDLTPPLEDEGVKRVVGFVSRSVEEEVGLPMGSVLSGGGLSEEELAHKLRRTLNHLLPSEMKPVSLEDAANVAVEAGLCLDEGSQCKDAMARAGEVLQGLEEGSAQYRETQLPLQGELWAKLAAQEKEECQQKRAGERTHPQLQKIRSSSRLEPSSYRMTNAMKAFTDTLFTSDKVERLYFLSWMKLRLQAMQRRQIDHNIQALQNDETKQEHDSENSANGNVDDEDEVHHFHLTSIDEEMEDEPQDQFVSEQQRFEEIQNSDPHPYIVVHQLMSLENTVDLNCDEPEIQPEERNLMSDVSDATQTTDLDSWHSELDPSSLGLEHFLREMGLIFELKHTIQGSGSHNVLRLPSLAADLLLYGVPVEIMDGDASNVPTKWLAAVLEEFSRHMARKRFRVRVLASVGVHHGGNSDLLLALFGVNVPELKRRFTKGIYMLPLSVPEDIRKELACDFLILVNVEGLCSPQLDTEKASLSLIRDNEMATVATRISDVLVHNVDSCGGNGLQSYLNVAVNALLRMEVYGLTPICQLVKQDEDLNSQLHALQLGRVARILQTEPENAGTGTNDRRSTQAEGSIPCVMGPWQKACLSAPVDEGYSEAVLEVKQNVFAALKRCGAKSKDRGLAEFMGHLTAVWEDVKAQSFPIGLQNTEVAEAFCMLCTELSQWENEFLGNMEGWFSSAATRLSDSKARALESGISSDLLGTLKDEAMEEVQTGVHKMESQVKSYLMKDDLHKTYIETYSSNLINHLAQLKEQTTADMIGRLESAKDNIYSSTQLENFQAMLEQELEFKHNKLTEASKSNNILFEDAQLEEEFEEVWNNALSNMTFRRSKTNDICARVTEILRANLINRKLQKHLGKLEDIAEKKDSDFVVNDDHFGYRSRMKHIGDNNRQQIIEAHQLACTIITDYNQYVAKKSRLLADFSDSYIEDVLKNVEKALTANPIEIKSVFEVDLKVYLCSSACQDFQEIHDRYAKDADLLTFIDGSKTRYQAEFIYQFRKRDQCQRTSQAFTTMSLKPIALAYIHRPLGTLLMEEMIDQDKTGQYLSPWDFNCTLLEELLAEDNIESYLAYLHSFDAFCLERIQERVVVHLSASQGLVNWRQRRLGEIIGRMAAAVSQAAEGVSGGLSDTTLLLEKVCLTLELDGDIEVPRDTLDSPLFSITIEWDRFVSCLLETLAELRLALAQEFSKNTEASDLLRLLPLKPQDGLLHRVRGCGERCPLCKAPCGVLDAGHRVHRTRLHRPRGLLSHACGLSRSLSHMSCPAEVARDNLSANRDAESKALARDHHAVHPDWSIPPEEPASQTLDAYWRYVMARFNERFAEEYEQKPANLPEEWKKITQEEALESLKEIREKAFRLYDTKQWLGAH